MARKYVACGKDMEGRGTPLALECAAHLRLVCLTRMRVCDRRVTAYAAAGEKTMETLMMMEGVVPYEGRRIAPVPWDKIPYGLPSSLRRHGLLSVSS
jgi:hypothetical protein